MFTTETEQLIHLIKTNRCLYDMNERDFKNHPKKSEIWNQIAEEMNQTCEEVQKKWKNLRDSYTKFKKEKLTRKERKEKKFSNWIWSPYLQFLDSTMQAQSKSKKNAVDLLENIAVIDNSTLHTKLRARDKSSPTTMIGITPSTDPLHLTLTPSTSRTNHSHQPTAKKRKMNPDIEDDNRALKYSKQDTNDAIDHLFLSYSETFKRLSPRTQVPLKVKLARLFAEAELRDLDVIGNSGSPAYSDTSFLVEKVPESTNDSSDSSNDAEMFQDADAVKIEAIPE